MLDVGVGTLCSVIDWLMISELEQIHSHNIPKSRDLNWSSHIFSILQHFIAFLSCNHVFFRSRTVCPSFFLCERPMMSTRSRSLSLVVEVWCSSQVLNVESVDSPLTGMNSYDLNIFSKNFQSNSNNEPKAHSRKLRWNESWTFGSRWLSHLGCLGQLPRPRWPWYPSPASLRMQRSSAVPGIEQQEDLDRKDQ